MIIELPMGRRGVHPIVSQVIIIAITLALLILAISWIMGVWSTEQEKFAVVPMLYVTSQGGGAGTTEPVLVLHVRNEGAREAVIIMVEIRTEYGSWVNTTQFVVPANSIIDINITEWEWRGEGSPPELIKGGKYRVIVYTEQWGSIFFDVTLTS